tara:strand:- start:1298 stop:1492 length:195 start_codon:yes stop_codon:yes gene_type:complete
MTLKDFWNIESSFGLLPELKEALKTNNIKYIMNRFKVHGKDHDFEATENLVLILKYLVKRGRVA